MPKNKKPNRKGKKPGKRRGADNAAGDHGPAPGRVPHAKGGKSAAGSFGAPKSSRSPISPATSRGAARSR